MGTFGLARPSKPLRKFPADFSRIAYSVVLDGERGVRVMLPLPGANFFYSVAKDAWGRVSSRWRGRHSLRSEVFRRWTVDKWYHPAVAIREFGDQDLLERSDEAHKEHSRLWKELPSGAYMTPEEYTSARHRADDASTRIQALDALLRENLQARLVSGELIARGFREPFPTARRISQSPDTNGGFSSWSCQTMQREAVSLTSG